MNRVHGEFPKSHTADFLPPAPPALESGTACVLWMLVQSQSLHVWSLGYWWLGEIATPPPMPLVCYLCQMELSPVRLQCRLYIVMIKKTTLAFPLCFPPLYSSPMTFPGSICRAWSKQWTWNPQMSERILKQNRVQIHSEFHAGSEVKV